MRLPTPERPQTSATVDFTIEDAPEVGPVQAELTLAVLTLSPGGAAASRLRLVGTVTFTYTTECARCLTRIETPVESRFESLLDLEAGTVEAADLETPPEEGGFEREGAGEIDLAGELRQRTLLAVPEVVTCRPDCKGLCSRCGQNLNVRDCDCHRGASRGPMAGLAALLQKKSDSPSGGR